MTTNTHYHRKPFIITFPERSDLYLKHLFHFGYFLFLTPFQILYDGGKQAYATRMNYPRLVISVLRLASMIMELLINRGSQFHIPSPGPMKVFITAFSYGGYFISMIYILLMNLPRTRYLVLNLLSLLTSSSRREVYNQQFSVDQNKDSNGKWKKLRLLLLIYFNYVFLICVMCIISTSSWHRMGFRSHIRHTWNTLADVLYPSGKTQRYRDMTWWMILAALWTLATKIDVVVVFATAVVSILLTVKTLQQISNHFVDNLKTSQMYCVVTSREIMFNYLRIRRSFILVNSIFAQLTLITIIYFSVSTCVMAVFAFTISQQSFPFTTACLDFYFFSILNIAADAAIKLRQMTKLFFSCRQSGGQLSLQRAVMMYELGTSSIGLSVSDIFVVTYAFVASVVVSVLSNATIVLQSLEFDKKAHPPPPPPPVEEE